MALPLVRSRSLPPFRLGVVAAGVFAAGLTLAHPALAQRGGDGFLFREPPGSLTLRLGVGLPTARSQVFSFVTDELTLGRRHFAGISAGADVAFRVSPRADVVFSLMYSGSRARSEFRDWVDQNSLPIEQTTVFERLPVTASLRWYLAPRGRSVGRLAWLPRSMAPYVGAGVGTMWYRFRQRGDFVDFQTLNVFPDRYESRAWTFTAQALAGMDLSLGAKYVISTEVRYLWSRAAMGADFSGFDRIDLSGLYGTAGIAVRF